MNRYRAEILTIGNELLRGSTLNTNACFLARELSKCGFEVAAQISCPDDVKVIQKKMKESFFRSDVLILTGGLGPTPDDVTRDAVASFFRVPLIFSPKQYQFIQAHYRRYKRKIPGMVRQEAMFPSNAVPLFNRYGIALGFYIKEKNRLLIVLPGVPHELEGMYGALVLPLLRKNFPHALKLLSFTLRMTGLGEPEVMERLGKDFFDEPFDFGIYPEPCEVAIHIQTPDKRIHKKLLQKARKRLEKWIFSGDERKLPEMIGAELVKRRQTLSLAESCTGGLLSSLITQVPGASRYFKGGVTAYSNEVKMKFLNVPDKVLSKKGAVSAETAGAMAENTRRKFATTYAIAITGIAGPDGGSAKKPVGLVHLAVATPHQTYRSKQDFLGNRRQVQLKAAKKALQMLWQIIPRR